MMNAIQTSSEAKRTQQAIKNRERQKRYYDANKAKMAARAHARYIAKKKLLAEAAAIVLASQLAPTVVIKEEEEEVLTCSKPWLWTPAYVSEQIELFRAVPVQEVPVQEVPVQEAEAVQEAEPVQETSTPPSKKREIGCRELSKCLAHGQRVRTAVSATKNPNLPQLVGSYDSRKDKIDYYGKYYSLNKFAQLQIELYLPDRETKSVSAWKNCMCEVKGKWVLMYYLPELSAA
jgi:hypothetical protein